MPTSLAELKAHLVSLGCSPDVANDRLLVIGLGTKHYVDSDGDKHVFVHIGIEDDGKWIRVYARSCYGLKDCKHKCATLAMLAELAYRRRSVQYGYDPSDGEVVYSTDMWVADGTITEEQLFCMLRQLVSTLDDFHPVVLHAMETGEVDFDRVARPSEVGGESDGMSEELAELLEKVGGIEGLRAIVEERDRQAAKPGS